MNLKKFNKLLNLAIAGAVVSLSGVLIYYYYKL